MPLVTQVEKQKCFSIPFDLFEADGDILKSQTGSICRILSLSLVIANREQPIKNLQLKAFYNISTYSKSQEMSCEYCPFNVTKYSNRDNCTGVVG